MLQINKSEPNYFSSVKNKVSNPNISQAWSDTNIEQIRFQLRSDILTNEQNMLCVYCEKEITSDNKKSNIDHYKTRHLFPNETLNYENLLVSCNSKYSCSRSKDNYLGLQQSNYEKMINPTFENPNDFFEYSVAGDIIIKNNLSPSDFEKAEFTLKVFALNCKSLLEERKAIVNMLITYKEEKYSIDSIFEYFQCYKSFIENIYPKL